MKNEIIELWGSRWLVREAKDRKEAITAIGYAKCSGSVGSKQLLNDEVLADVVQINSDGTERKPYTIAW